MASLKVNLKGIGDFECTGNPEFISPEIEKFYAAVFSDAELESCTEPGCEKPKDTEPVRPHDPQNVFCTITKTVESDPELNYAISMMQKGDLTFSMGDVLTVPLKDGTTAAFVMTQEDDEAYRFESVDCIGGKTVTHDKIDELFENYMDLLPSVLVENMLLTKRRYRDRNDAIHERESLLFLPSAPEVFPEDDVYGDSGLYEQMEYYKDRRHRMRKLTPDSEDTVSWWLMSAYAGPTGYFCIVTSYGYAANASASATWIGAPVCFRIRKSK